MNNISIVIKASHFKYSPDHITGILGLTPSSIHLAGEEYLIGPLHNQLVREYEYNYWEYRVEIVHNDVWVMTLLSKFILEVILPRKDKFEEIKGECSFELYVNVLYDNNVELESFHFDMDMLTLLTALNFEIDIDQGRW
jgi:Domain of unknown function (DUF4279)